MALRKRRNQPGGLVESHRRPRAKQRTLPLPSNQNCRNIAAVIFLGLAAFSLNRVPTVDRNRKSAAIVGTAQNGTAQNSAENKVKNVIKNDEGDIGHDADGDGGNKERGNPPTFQWDYLGKKIVCGTDKCLFHSSSRVNDTAGSDPEKEDPNCGDESGYRTGYLVSRDKQGGKNDESILDGWEITQYLVERFGIKHLFLEPPIRAPQLRQNAAPKIVQKVRIAPTTSRQVKHPDFVAKSLDQLLDGFLEKSGTPEKYNSRNLKAIAAAEGCGFFERLDGQLARTVELLRCEPLMALDFQFIVDASGNLYHLDFDRVINNNGGPGGYDQTKFNSKLRVRLGNAFRLLDLARRWTRGKRLQARKARANAIGNSTAVAIPEQVFPSSVPSDARCKGDWEAEETRILASNNLPCLATERVAIARHWRSTTESNEKNVTAPASAVSKAGEKGDRLKHPLLVAMLQRVIEAGFYENEDNEHLDCDVFGDRVVSQ